MHPPTTEFTKDGVPITPKALCYVDDWYKGFAVLTAYKAGTYKEGMECDLDFQDDPKKAVERIIADYAKYKRVEMKGIKQPTFAEVFEMYYEDKFVNSPKEYSAGYLVNMRSAFKRCKEIHDMEFSKISLDDLQNVMDTCPLKHSSLEAIKLLYNGMYNYAVPHGITDKDFSKYVKINKKFDDEHGVPFTVEQLQEIAKHKDNKTAMRIIVMCLTGFRIREYEKANILSDRIIGGGKTKAGTDRLVPIHDSIKPIIEYADMNHIVYLNFLRSMKRFLQSIGIEKHTPHDCRHTFSMLCDKFGVYHIAKSKMLGHSLAGNMSDGVYGHWDYDMLKEEIDKISLTFY